MFGSAFPLFKIFGIQVVTNWSIILLGLFGSSGGAGFSGAAAVILTVLLHELGHALTAKSKGAYVDQIVIGFVGLASFAGHLSSAQRALIAFAGPAVNLITAVVSYVLLMQFGNLGNFQIFFQSLVLWGGLLGIFNLVPALPMDGGWVVQHLLEMRMDASKARIIALKVTLVASVGLIFSSSFFPIEPFFMILFGGYFFFKAFVELKARQLFSPGAGMFEGFMNERKAKQQEKQEKKKQENSVEIRAKIDQLLVKISKEGMSSLTSEERDYLTKNSSNYPKP